MASSPWKAAPGKQHLGHVTQDGTPQESREEETAMNEGCCDHSELRNHYPNISNT